MSIMLVYLDCDAQFDTVVSFAEWFIREIECVDLHMWYAKRLLDVINGSKVHSHHMQNELIASGKYEDVCGLVRRLLCSIVPWDDAFEVVIDKNIVPIARF